MVVDVATALMYGTQGHSSLCPMFGLDTMSTLGKNCTVGYWYCLQCNHCWANGVRATVEDSRGCGLSCVTPLQGASTWVKVAICVE